MNGPLSLIFAIEKMIFSSKKAAQRRYILLAKSTNNGKIPTVNYGLRRLIKFYPIILLY
jgi:hypothetical protein